MSRTKARPAIPISCPDRGTGTLAAEDIRGEADPDGGVRIVRRTRRGRHVGGRVRLSRLAHAPDA